MIKHLIIAILIALPLVASANTRDKYPKHKGFNYKKHRKHVKKQQRHSRHSNSCRQWIHS
jgi:hypothetical protein